MKQGQYFKKCWLEKELDTHCDFLGSFMSSILIKTLKIMYKRNKFNNSIRVATSLGLFRQMYLLKTIKLCLKETNLTIRYALRALLIFSIRCTHYKPKITLEKHIWQLDTHCDLFRYFPSNVSIINHKIMFKE